MWRDGVVVVGGEGGSQAGYFVVGGLVDLIKKTMYCKSVASFCILGHFCDINPCIIMWLLNLAVNAVVFCHGAKIIILLKCTSRTLRL